MERTYYVFESETIGIFTIQANTYGDALWKAQNIITDADFKYTAFEWELDKNELKNLKKT